MQLQTNSILPLVELESREQSKILSFFSTVEKDWRLPRFASELIYSEDGIYKRGYFAVHGGDGGTAERVYFDSQGTGIFDIMDVYENGIRSRYHLNGLTWKQVDEQ